MDAFFFIPFLFLTLFSVLQAQSFFGLFHFLTTPFFLTQQDFDYEMKMQLIKTEAILLSKSKSELVIG